VLAVEPLADASVALAEASVAHMDDPSPALPPEMAAAMGADVGFGGAPLAVSPLGFGEVAGAVKFEEEAE